MAHKATLKEYEDFWQSATQLVDRLDEDRSLIEGSWTKPALVLAMFKTMCRQKGWRIPLGA